MKYQYLLLDFDNTLVDFDETEKRALTQAVKDCLGIEITEEERLSYHRINDMYWKALERREIQKDRLKSLRFRDFLVVLNKNREGLPLISPEELNARYVHYLSTIVVEFPEATEVCRRLSEHFQLFIITNGATEVQEGRMAGCGFRPYVKKMFISEQYGISKPDPRFMEDIIAFTGDSERSQYLVIGDSPTSDMKFAENAGLDACLIKTNNKVKAQGRWQYEISDISELPNLLFS